MALRCTTAVNAPSTRDHHYHDTITTTPLRRLGRVPSPPHRWRSGHFARRRSHRYQGAPHHCLAADVASNGRRTLDTDLLPLLSKPYTAAQIETRTSPRICAWVPEMRFPGELTSLVLTDAKIIVFMWSPHFLFIEESSLSAEQCFLETKTCRRTSLRLHALS